jgi:hypothetical protein
MSDLSELQSDLRRNQKAIEARITNGGLKGDVGTHLRDTLWPFLYNVVEAIAVLKTDQDEMAEVVDDLIQNADDILHEDTSRKFRECLGVGVALATALSKRLDLANADDKMLKTQIDAYVLLSAEVGQIIADITIPDNEEDGDDEGDEDGDDQDDAGEDGEEANDE